MIKGSIHYNRNRVVLSFSYVAIITFLISLRFGQLNENIFVERPEHILKNIFWLIFVVYIVYNIKLERKNSKKNHNLMAILAVLLWLFFYFANLNSREIFYNYFGIPPMLSGLSDFTVITDLLNCGNQSGCDRFGRPQAYGSGWNYLFFLGYEDFSIIIGGIALYYLTYKISEYLEKFSNNKFSIFIILSPSYLFAIERGNTDIMISASIFFVMSLITKNKAKSDKLIKVFVFLFSVFLASLKFMFFPVIFFAKYRNLTLLLLLGSLFFVTIWSYRFDFQYISYIKNYQTYFPVSTFGVDQMPKFFVYSALNLDYRILEVWQNPTYSRMSQIIGIAFMMAIYILLKPNIEKFLKNNYSNYLNDPIFIVFLTIYFVTYIFGTQVNYKLFLLFPLLILVESYICSKSKKNIIGINIIVFTIIGIFGLNIWMLRSIGTFVIGVLTLGVLVSYVYTQSERLISRGAQK
jgi:hypothetical protein